MKEQIGKVILNLEYYQGSDLYSDGDIENTLLEIVKAYPESEYGKLIEEKASWPVLYHLSPMRANLIDWIDFRKASDTVLEIGAGCGALTGVLAKKTKQVTCIELSKRRSTISAVRHRELDNIEICVGNFEDIEPHLPQFNAVMMIGVLEYAQNYIHSPEPHLEFLKKAWEHLAPGGRLVLGIENKLGMKYWAGCPEDHTGRYFDSIEGYPEGGAACTFSKRELGGLLRRAGYEGIKFYYPYPDYKLPLTIYSDLHLPQRGSLCQTPNFSGDRLLVFNERRAYDSIIAAGLFPEFSNSFLILAEK